MVDASSLVIPCFHDVLGDVMAHGHTHYCPRDVQHPLDVPDPQQLVSA